MYKYIVWNRHSIEMKTMDREREKRCEKNCTRNQTTKEKSNNDQISFLKNLYI